MCGSLRLENTQKKIGNLVSAIDANGKEVVAIWHGFVRSERPLTNNERVRQEKVVIPASSYNEKGTDFSIPEGRGIEAIITTRKDTKFRGLFIRTRDATPEEKKRNKHPRHPKIVDRK